MRVSFIVYGIILSYISSWSLYSPLLHPQGNLLETTHFGAADGVIGKEIHMYQINSALSNLVTHSSVPQPLPVDLSIYLSLLRAQRLHLNVVISLDHIWPVWAIVPEPDGSNPCEARDGLIIRYYQITNIQLRIQKSA